MRTSKIIGDIRIHDRHYKGETGTFIENGEFCFFIPNIRPNNVITVWTKGTLREALRYKLRYLHYTLKQEFNKTTSLNEFQTNVLHKIKEVENDI